MSEADGVSERAATGIGARLRDAREGMGLSLDDVVRQTRVPMRHLVQIEKGELSGLPAAPYSAGFVKAYARVVGIDPTAAGHEFRAEFDRQQNSSGRTPYEPYEPADPSRLPPRLLALVALAIAVVLVVGYGIWRSGLVGGEGSGERARIAAEGVAPPPAAVPAPGAPRPAAPAATAPTPVPAGGAVVLTATAPTWFKVSERSGAVLFQGTMEAGKSYTVPATAADPVIRTGKPEGLAVTVGGRPVAPLGEPARTVANLSLKPEALAARPMPAGAAPAPTPAAAPASAPAAPGTPAAPAAFRAATR